MILESYINKKCEEKL